MNQFLPSTQTFLEKVKNFENGNIKLTKDSFIYITNIGSGSFGKVYKASSKQTSNIYALKILSKRQLLQTNLMEQLKNEISILSICNHENIIKLYTAFEDNQFVYLVMEYAQEGTLFHKLKKQQKFSEQQTIQYMFDIIQAVYYMHSQNPAILHRDLKPENILISQEGKCKIADFGWSNVEDQFRNTFCGTPDYLAPEMIQGIGHNEKLDIWTLGVLMYELLHGNPPFSTNLNKIDYRLAQKEIQNNILKGNVSFDSNISQQAKEMILSMLKPISSQRPSAKELLESEYFNKLSKSLKTVHRLNIFDKQIKPSQETEASQLRKQIMDQEQKIESLISQNKYLTEQLSQKEQFLNQQKQENDSLMERLKKSLEENLNMNSTIEQAQKKNSQLDQALNQELMQNQLIIQQNSNQNQTLNALFEKTKSLTKSISDFYITYVVNDYMNQTEEGVINYDTAMLKLNEILNEFIKMKQQLTKKQYQPFQGIMTVDQIRKEIKQEKQQLLQSTQLKMGSPMKANRSGSSRMIGSKDNPNFSKNKQLEKSAFTKNN